MPHPGSVPPGRHGVVAPAESPARRRDVPALRTARAQELPGARMHIGGAVMPVLKEEHFGTYLRRGREARGLSIADLSRATKIKESVLELVEAARLEALPAQVFVRGF